MTTALTRTLSPDADAPGQSRVGVGAACVEFRGTGDAPSGRGRRFGGASNAEAAEAAEAAKWRTVIQSGAGNGEGEESEEGEGAGKGWCEGFGSG